MVPMSTLIATDEKPFSLRRETLAASVRSEIERQILSGDLQAGEKLNEVALAERLDVSRGTVREAIRTLAESGLIDLLANRGAFVRSLTVEEIRNLYHLRGAVFAMACAAVAERAKAEPIGHVLDALNANLNAMRVAYHDDDRAAYYELNIAFHALLMGEAQNPRAKAVYEGLVKEMHLFRRRGLSVSPNIARSIEEHAAIVDAVAQADIDGARQAAQHHIDEGLKRFLKTLDEEVSEPELALG